MIELSEKRSEENKPPSYAEAKSTPKTEDTQPPSYFSFINDLKRAKEESNNNLAAFAAVACAILCGSTLVGIGFLIATAIPITSIVIGAINLNKCPIQRYIPIYLTVSGSVGLFLGCLKSITNFTHRNVRSVDDKRPASGSGSDGLSSCITCFLFAWFIAGNVWVYSNYKVVQHTNSTLTNYCDHTCYYYAFGLITATWAIVALGLVCSVILCFLTCCGVVCGGAISAFSDKEPNNANDA